METYLSKMSMWLSKQAKKMNAIEKSSVFFEDSKTKTTVKANFIEFCKILVSLLEKSEKAPVDDISTPSEMSARDSVKVARIAPKKSRRNSVG